MDPNDEPETELLDEPSSAIETARNSEYAPFHASLLRQKIKPQLLVHHDCPASRTAQVFLSLAKIDVEEIKADSPNGKRLMDSLEAPALPALILGDECICETHNILRMVSTLPTDEMISWYERHAHSVIDLWLRWRYVNLGRAIMDHMTRKNLAVKATKQITNPVSRLIRCLKILEKVLKSRRYVCSQNYPTIADISIAAALVDLELVDLDWERYPSLRNWYFDIVSRDPNWGRVFDPVYFKVAQKRGFSSPKQTHLLSASLQPYSAHLSALVKTQSVPVSFDFFDPEWKFLEYLPEQNYALPLTRTEEKMLIDSNIHKAPPRQKESKRLSPRVRYNFDSSGGLGCIRIVVNSKVSSILPIPKRVEDLQSLCLYLQSFYPHSRLVLCDENGAGLYVPKSPKPEAWEALLPVIYAIHVVPPTEHRNFNKTPQFNYRPVLISSLVSGTNTCLSAATGTWTGIAGGLGPELIPGLYPGHNSATSSSANLQNVHPPNSAPFTQNPTSSNQKRQLFPHPRSPANSVPHSPLRHPPHPSPQSPPQPSNTTPVKGKRKDNRTQAQESLPAIQQPHSARSSSQTPRKEPRTQPAPLPPPHPSIPTNDFPVSLPNIGIRGLVPARK